MPPKKMSPSALVRWREARELSQHQLAVALGVDNMTISRWERSERAIPRMLPLALRAVDEDLKKE